METITTIKNCLNHTENINIATHYDLETAKYYILRENKNTEFWKNFCKLCEHKKNEKKDESISSESYSEDSDGEDEFEEDTFKLAEVAKRDDKVPLILEFEIKFNSEMIKKKLEHQYQTYDHDFITGIVKGCQKTIDELYIISNDKSELICCFLETKQDQYEGNFLVTRFKLQFPNLKINPSVDFNEFRSLLVLKLKKSNLIGQLQCYPSNNWDDIIVKNNKNIYPLYLCGDYIYELEKIYDSFGSDRPPKEIEKFFFPNKHNDYITGNFNPGMDISKVNFWKSMFLSIKYGVKTAKKKETGDSDGYGNSLNFRIRKKDTEDQIKCKQLVSMIDKYRFNKRYFWIDIGKALYNTYDGENGGLRIWKSLTKLSDVFSTEMCTKIYTSFENDNNLTVKTIGWYARKDSPVMYDRWLVDRTTKAITDALTMNRDFEVGKVFEAMFWLDYVCAGVKKNIWYKYERHRWVKIDGASKIRNIISTNFTKALQRYKNNLIIEVGAAGGRREREQGDIFRTNIIKIIRDAGNYNKKNILVRQLADLMEDENFSENLDKNCNVMGVRNGVIECLKDKAIFREGKPEDYLSYQSRSKYNPKMTWEHRSVKKLMRWYKQLYPEKAVRQYVLKIFASFLQGRNVDKKLYFFTGDTNAGKSILKKFFECILGQYSFTLPEGVFANSKYKSSNGLKPGLALAMKSNVTWVLENNATMNGNDIKLNTGNDKMFVRLMGENGGNETPRFKIIYICNMVPIIIAPDNAITERVLIVPHLSVWSHDAPESEEEQFKQRIFKRDNDFDLKLHRLASAGLWIMLKYFKKYRKEKLVMPASIQEATDNYWEQNDVYGSFTTDQIVETESDVPLTVDAVHIKFSSWLESHYPDMDRPNINTLKYVFSQRWKKKGWEIEGSNWYGISLRRRGNVIANGSFD